MYFENKFLKYSNYLNTLKFRVLFSRTKVAVSTCILFTVPCPISLDSAGSVAPLLIKVTSVLESSVTFSSVTFSFPPGQMNRPRRKYSSSFYPVNHFFFRFICTSWHMEFVSCISHNPGKNDVICVCFCCPFICIFCPFYICYQTLCHHTVLYVW